MVYYWFVRCSRVGTAQSRRRTRPRKYIRGAAQILKALHLQTFLGHSGAARISSIQIRLAIGLRTWATLTKKWIPGRTTFSAHSAGKRSKDLHAHPNQIHSDRGAAHWEGVNLNMLHFRHPKWFS